MTNDRKQCLVSKACFISKTVKVKQMEEVLALALLDMFSLQGNDSD